MFHNNPALTGVNAGEALLTPYRVRGLGLRWRDDDIDALCGGGGVCGVVVGEPIVAGGVVYIDTYSPNLYYGTLLALNEQSGRLLWSFQIIGNMLASPAVVNGVVYVTDDHQTLYARNAMTGAPLWSYTGVSPYASPTVVNGVVYVGSTAVNATTGKLLWSASGVPGSFGNTAAVVNGVVYGVAGNGTLSALNAATGAVLWTYQDFDVKLTASPAVANGVVYASLHTAVYAINATTGAKLWSYDDGARHTSPSVANGVVYIGGN
jgi:outer membrane protein assembly factor BamB